MQLKHLTEQDTAIAELTQKMPAATSKWSDHLPWQHSRLLQVWCCDQWDLSPRVISKSKEIATPLPFFEGVVRAAKIPQLCVCVHTGFLPLLHWNYCEKDGSSCPEGILSQREGGLCSKKGGKGVNKQEWRALRLWSQTPGVQTIGEQWARAWSTWPWGSAPSRTDAISLTHVRMQQQFNTRGMYNPLSSLHISVKGRAHYYYSCLLFICLLCF